MKGSQLLYPVCGVPVARSATPVGSSSIKTKGIAAATATVWQSSTAVPCYLPPSLPLPTVEERIAELYEQLATMRTEVANELAAIRQGLAAERAAVRDHEKQLAVLKTEVEDVKEAVENSDTFLEGVQENFWGLKEAKRGE